MNPRVRRRRARRATPWASSSRSPPWPVQCAILGANRLDSGGLAGARAIAVNKVGTHTTWLVVTGLAIYAVLDDGYGRCVVLAVADRGARGSVPAHFKMVGQTRYLVVMGEGGPRSVVVAPPRSDAIRLSGRVLELLERMVPRAAQSENRMGSASVAMSSV